MSHAEREFVIPAGHARMWRMRAGERATIAQTEGHQVGDLIAFNATDLAEFLSPSHTRRCVNSIRVAKGSTLYMIARTVASLGRCLTPAAAGAATLCMAYRGQNPVLRLQENNPG